MPTARELLEQADALMRRNRMDVGGDTPGRPARTGKDPPTVSPTSGLPPAARTIQREPIAPSVARTALPVDPTVSPAFAVPPRSGEPPSSPPPAASTDEAPPEVEAEFPLLTEAVDEPEAAESTPLDDLSDDVPLLTDAVEEIDVGIVDEVVRGEPSIWELTARGETSVLGPAPDSIVLVPPPEDLPAAVPQAPPEGRDPLGLDQPPLGYPPSDETDSTVQGRIDPADAILQPADGARKPDTDAGEQPQPASQDLESGEPYRPPPTVDPWRRDAGSDDADEPTPAVSFSIADRAPEDAREAEIAAESLSDAQSSVQATFSTPPQVSDLDQQRIREIAEEIGMQVLQRIDIFTDTTLRAQLGERLRPVVERAAADLVASINEHVGELLRAYVSEAIEREIESWRGKDRG